MRTLAEPGRSEGLGQGGGSRGFINAAWGEPALHLIPWAKQAFRKRTADQTVLGGSPKVHSNYLK